MDVKHSMHTVVMAYLGDVDSAEQLARLAASPDTRVVAVVFDRGAGPSAANVRASARAGGALRCHVLDVRDSFVREVTWPAAQMGTGAHDSVFAALHASFINNTLSVVAGIEQALPVGRAAYAPLASPLPSHVPRQVRLELRFHGSEPVALNGVAMTPGELVESIETITGVAAVDVCALAYGVLGRAPGGVVSVIAHDGVCRAENAAPLPA